MSMNRLVLIAPRKKILVLLVIEHSFHTAHHYIDQYSVQTINQFFTVQIHLIFVDVVTSEVERNKNEVFLIKIIAPLSAILFIILCIK